MPCQCATGTELCTCTSGLLERPRYFARQLITPGDLTLEATYFRDRLRRHNRLLHGWGVVCGAQVCPVFSTNGSGAQQPWKVVVNRGYILGPYGDEIVIATERIVDLRTDGVTITAGDPGGEVTDPWCSQVYVERQPGTICVAVKYCESTARPVRVQPAGCGCDDTRCEYSRWCDGYEIGILPNCPSSHQQPPDREGLYTGSLSDCPSCPTDPWVVLAEVAIDEGGQVTIVNCSCRRMIASFATFWWQCQEEQRTAATGPTRAKAAAPAPQPSAGAESPSPEQGPMPRRAGPRERRARAAQPDTVTTE